MTARRIAAIDVGTNTALLAICTFDGTLRVERDERRVVRLGEGVDAAGRIGGAALSRFYAALDDYAAILAERPVDHVVLAGTSASRDAANRESLIRGVRERYGWRYRVLSGEEEARLTYRGAVAFLPSAQGALVIDVGGGSTELVHEVGREGLQAVSLDVGSVRITERCFTTQPPSAIEVEYARRTVRDALESAGLPKLPVLVGTAGTAVVLALLHVGDSDAWRLTREDVRAWSERLLGMSNSEVRALNPRLLEGRDDVFAAGVLIIRETLEAVDADELIVSSGGLRHGLALEHFDRG